MQKDLNLVPLLEVQIYSDSVILVHLRAMLKISDLGCIVVQFLVLCVKYNVEIVIWIVQLGKDKHAV